MQVRELLDLRPDVWAYAARLPLCFYRGLRRATGGNLDYARLKRNLLLDRNRATTTFFRRTGCTVMLNNVASPRPSTIQSIARSPSTHHRNGMFVLRVALGELSGHRPACKRKALGPLLRTAGTENKNRLPSVNTQS